MVPTVVATISIKTAASLVRDRRDDGRGVLAARLELCCIVFCFFELKVIAVVDVLVSSV